MYCFIIYGSQVKVLNDRQYFQHLWSLPTNLSRGSTATNQSLKEEETFNLKLEFYLAPHWSKIVDFTRDKTFKFLKLVKARYKIWKASMVIFTIRK